MPPCKLEAVVHFNTSTWTRQPLPDTALSAVETLPALGTTFGTAQTDMAESMTTFCHTRPSPRSPPRSRRKLAPDVEADSTTWILTCEQAHPVRISLPRCPRSKLPTHLQANSLLQNLSQNYQLQNLFQNYQLQNLFRNYQLQIHLRTTSYRTYFRTTSS